ncbi:hypothetical protein K3495_g118, partial [Podosphaera aphanis]
MSPKPRHPTTRSMSKTTAELDDSQFPADNLKLSEKVKDLSGQFEDISGQFRDFEKQHATRDREASRHLNSIERKQSEMEEANRTQFASIKADMKSLAATQTRQAEASKLREAAMNDKFASMETALDNNTAKMEALSHSQRLQALNYESRLEKSENLLQLVVDRLDSLTNLISSNVSVAPKSELIEAPSRVDKGKQPEIPKAAPISPFVPPAIKRDLSIPETQRSAPSSSSASFLDPPILEKKTSFSPHGSSSSDAENLSS